MGLVLPTVSQGSQANPRRPLWGTDSQANRHPPAVGGSILHMANNGLYSKATLSPGGAIQFRKSASGLPPRPIGGRRALSSKHPTRIKSLIYSLLPWRSNTGSQANPATLREADRNSQAATPLQSSNPRPCPAYRHARSEITTKDKIQKRKPKQPLKAISKKAPWGTGRTPAMPAPHPVPRKIDANRTAAELRVAFFCAFSPLAPSHWLYLTLFFPRGASAPC